MLAGRCRIFSSKVSHNLLLTEGGGGFFLRKSENIGEVLESAIER